MNIGENNRQHTRLKIRKVRAQKTEYKLKKSSYELLPDKIGKINYDARGKFEMGI